MNTPPAAPRPPEPGPTEPALEPIVDPAALPAARALRTRVAAVAPPPRAARPGAARPGDAIVLVGAIGRGGAAVLALACGPWLRQRVPPADLVQAKAWPGGPGWDVAVLAARIADVGADVGNADVGADVGIADVGTDDGIDAGTADQYGAIHACIALGDGGLARACHDVARAAHVDLRIDAGAVPLHAGTARICDALGLNPLDVQSAGTLLFTATPNVAVAAVAQLTTAGHDAAVVGQVVEGPSAVTLVMGGSHRPLGLRDRDAVDDVLDRSTG